MDINKEYENRSKYSALMTAIILDNVEIVKLLIYYAYRHNIILKIDDEDDENDEKNIFTNTIIIKLLEKCNKDGIIKISSNYLLNVFKGLNENEVEKEVIERKKKELEMIENLEMERIRQEFEKEKEEMERKRKEFEKEKEEMERMKQEFEKEKEEMERMKQEFKKQKEEMERKMKELE